ncbi:MAG: MarR family transcriptional regulator [Actinobacteria bacterium]|nr:MarR family transcriptional regulator [Actinomycetota bacterium]
MSQRSSHVDRAAAELDALWVEIGRFFLSRKLRSKLHRGVASELSPVQLQAIAVLAEASVRVGELADQLGLAESSVTRLVDRLEGHRLVVRRVLPTDRRSIAVALTPAGRRVAEAVARGRRAYLTEMLEALEPSERGELVRLFAKVASAQAEKEERERGTKVRRTS